jgi:hypothetical protein
MVNNKTDQNHSNMVDVDVTAEIKISEIPVE